MTNEKIIQAIENMRESATFSTDAVTIDRDAYSVLVRLLSTLKYEESREVSN